MISYPYEELFNKDSIDKQLHITDGDSINLGNSEIYQESFELVETLCSERDLYYGACNSAILRFTTSNLSEFKGKTLTVSVVLANHTEAPFQFGVYKVYEDKFTADRTKKEIVCYDALYEVINANVVDWYNTILPDMETTVTLKQFRDSFFAQFGITQEAIVLDNDDMVVERTISATTLSGSDVLKSICSVNGCFGRINRQGNFEYFYVHQTTNPIYPAITLYPSEDLYPAFDGDYDATEVGRNGTYIKCQFEDYDVMPIDKLIIRDEEGEVGYTYGNGTNAYVLQGNFLLYGKNSTELQPIAENIYNKIEGAYYRPCEIEIKGNPCFEIGDGIYIKPTNASRFVTIITNRTYSGIQAQRDIFVTEGTEYRDENLNSPSEQMYQLRGYSNRINRTLEHTISELENFEEGVASEFEQTASDISAKVSKTDHNQSNTFGWTLDVTGFDVKSNGNSVFKVNSTGAEIKGKITAESGYIGNGSQGFTIGNTAIYNGTPSMQSLNKGIYVGVDGIRVNGGSGTSDFIVNESGEMTAKKATIQSGYIGGASQGFTIGNYYIYNGLTGWDDNTHYGIYISTNGLRSRYQEGEIWLQGADGQIKVKNTFSNIEYETTLMGHEITFSKANVVQANFGYQGIRIFGGEFMVDKDQSNNPRIGFFGGYATQQTVTGSTDSQKLSSLLTALRKYGLIL